MKKITSLLCVCFLWACQKNQTEDLFGQSPTLRIEQKQQELLEELTSAENGWKLSYQTNDKKFGGFTFLMKFDTDFNVTMSSDFNEQTITQQKSSYLIKTGQGTMLSFVTKNHIHNLADATLGETGKGYQGEFEFIYLGKENDKLKFRTQRGTSKEIYLEKATANDWATTINLLGSVSAFEKDSYRHFVRITTADGQRKDYRMSLNNLRYMTLRSFSNPSQEFQFGLTPTSRGFSLSPAPTFEGVTFPELIWDNSATPARYITQIDGVTMEILFSANPRPEHITDDFQDVFSKMDEFQFQTEYLKNTPTTSVLFKEEILTNDTPDFDNVGISFTSNTDAMVYVVYNFGRGRLLLGVSVTYELRNKKLYFNSSGGLRASNRAAFDIWFAPENQTYYNQAISALSRLYNLGTQGFNIEKRSEKYRWTNDIYVFQSGPYYFPTYAIPR